MVERIHVAGTDKGDILIYALSTCVWCKKAKSLLETKGIAYDYIFVDQQEGDDKKTTMDEVAKWNPVCSFPTIVINGKCIVGFKEEEILENLK
jgi:glutaredoxin-like protein NrdH